MAQQGAQPRGARAPAGGGARRRSPGGPRRPARAAGRRQEDGDGGARHGAGGARGRHRGHAHAAREPPAAPVDGGGRGPHEPRTGGAAATRAVDALHAPRHRPRPARVRRAPAALRGLCPCRERALPVGVRRAHRLQAGERRAGTGEREGRQLAGAAGRGGTRRAAHATRPPHAAAATVAQPTSRPRPPWRPPSPAAPPRTACLPARTPAAPAWPPTPGQRPRRGAARRPRRALRRRRGRRLSACVRSPAAADEACLLPRTHASCARATHAGR